MKRILSVILSLILLLSSAAFGFAAYAAEGDTALENPLYAERPVLYSPSVIPVNVASETKKYGGKTYYSDGKQLYLSYKNQLVQRKESCTLYYVTKNQLSWSYQKRNLLDKLFICATEEELATGCTDGDYLRWAIKGYPAVFTLNATVSGYYYYTIKINASYYDTLSEEQQVDSAVNSFLSGVDTNKLSDYEIIKKVHDYICSKTKYDYSAAEEYSSDKYAYAFSPYGTLIKGKSVCQGYAASFYRICKELGYSVRFVSSSPRRGCHAWNIIKLDGKYYFVDCTWDDEIAEGKSEFSAPQDYYFLINYDNARAYDYNSNHLLDGDYYDNADFYNNYELYFDENDYDRDNTELLSRCTVSLNSKSYSFDGGSKTPFVTVTTASGAVLENGADYTVSYTNNKNAGCARAQITGLGGYDGANTHRHYIIYPNVTYTPWVSAYDSTSVTLKWKAAEGGVTGYRVEQYKDGKWSYIGYSTSTTYKAKVPSATKQSFRIRAYKEVSKRHYFGKYSAGVNAYSKPAQPSIKSLSSKKKKLTVKWNKVNCTGYEIQYSVNKNMKGAKTVKASYSSVSKTIAKLKKGKKYYIRIRAYKTYNINSKNTTFYGAWSAKKSVKIK